jgi:cytidylate kinase
VITVSRQYGSSGDDIASRVSVILGYRYFDKALMAEVASDVGLSRDEVVDFSEDQHRVYGFLDRLFAGPWQESGLRVPGGPGQPLPEAELINLVEGIVRAACKQDDIVIVGRGGQALLRGVPNVLHVRVEAPLETRTRNVQLKEDLSPLAARQRIAERDQAAEDYLRRFYQIDWSDPSLYHLVINTGKWDVEAAARLVSAATNCLPINRLKPEAWMPEDRSTGS